MYDFICIYMFKFVISTWESKCMFIIIIIIAAILMTNVVQLKPQQMSIDLNVTLIMKTIFAFVKVK